MQAHLRHRVHHDPHHRDGTTTTTVTKTARVTYKQNWPAYNAAQTHEGAHFGELLHGLRHPRRHGAGRPSAALSDVVFSAVYKVYSTMSGRRIASDLRESKGYVSKVPSYNCTFKYLENPTLTPILKALIKALARSKPWKPHSPPTLAASTPAALSGGMT